MIKVYNYFNLLGHSSKFNIYAVINVYMPGTTEYSKIFATIGYINSTTILTSAATYNNVLTNAKIGAGLPTNQLTLSATTVDKDRKYSTMFMNFIHTPGAATTTYTYAVLALNGSDSNSGGYINSSITVQQLK